MSRFVPADRDTAYLLPPSVDEWLPGDHLARFVVEVIEQLDLRELTGQYAGRGSAAPSGRAAGLAGGLANAEQLTVGKLGGSFETGNLPMTPQVAHEVLVETQAPRGHTALGVEDARDGRIGIVLRQSTYQGDGVFVGANGGRSRARQRNVAFSELAAAPA